MEESQEQQKRILIAEDDQFLSDVLADKLRREGYEVLVVNNGQKALDNLESFKPNLVLLDLMMPEKDGFSVLVHMRESPNLKDVPVYVLSNLGQDSDVKEVMQMGATGYFVKSDINLGDLVPKIKAIFHS